MRFAKPACMFARLFHEMKSPTLPVTGNGNGPSASVSGNWPDFGTRLKRIYWNEVVAGSQAVFS